MSKSIKPKQNAAGTTLDSKYNIPFYINTFPVVIWDFKTLNVIDVNETAVSVYGYTREEFLKINIRDIRPEEDIVLLEELTRDEETYGSVHKRIWRHKKKSGEIMFVEVSGYIATIENRRVVIAHAYDVTSRIESEKKLRESEERYRILFNKSPLPKLIFDISTYKILEVNETAVIDYGYSREEFLNMTILDYRPPQDVNRVNHILSTIGHADVVHRLGMYDHIKKDGTIIKVDVTGHRLNYQNTDCMLVEFNDVTKRESALQKIKENEQKLHDSRQQLLLIYANVKDSIFLIDVGPGSTYTFSSVNQSFMDTTGLNEADVIGKCVNDIIPQPSLTTVLAKYHEAIQTQNKITWEEITDYPTGKKTGIVNITPVFNADGVCTQLVGSVHDITEIKEEEHTIALQNKKLLDIAWMQSHLTRAPVANILGLVNLIKNTPLSPEENDELIDHISESAVNLDKIIRSMIKQIDTI